MRLDKFISNCGAATRSEVKKLVKNGSVTVNGAIAKKPDIKIDENKDVVCVSGAELNYREFVYLMLNKPKGYISATEDKHYPVVTELVPEEYAHYNVFPVGRLDIDTEGLLLLTNDGQFDHYMTSPKKNIYKRYFARLDRPAEDEDIEIFKNGMKFKEFTAKSARLEITENPAEVYIEIAEGKFHQVKRMCERVGKNVIYLKRVAIGSLPLDESLEKGKVRPLTEDEMRLLGVYP
ncbi:MAG: pseudouridine synthase [bacterium]|nr:pseudouridine synthase [bacterium]